MEEGKAVTYHYATVTKDFVLSRDTRFFFRNLLMHGSKLRVPLSFGAVQRASGSAPTPKPLVTTCTTPCKQCWGLRGAGLKRGWQDGGDSASGVSGDSGDSGAVVGMTPMARAARTVGGMVLRWVGQGQGNWGRGMRRQPQSFNSDACSDDVYCSNSF